MTRVLLFTGQHLPAASEDHEEHHRQDEKPEQLPGRPTVLSVNLSLPHTSKVV